LKFLVEMVLGAAYFFGGVLVALVGRAAKVTRAFSYVARSRYAEQV